MDKSTLASLETSALISFIEVAERGSFTAAAIALNLSQPTVSQQVRRLESFVGVRLLHRRSNKVYLSPAGETFIAYCRTGLKDIEAGIISALRTSTAPVEKVTLGITCFNTQRCLSNVLQPYRQQNPNVHIQILECLPNALVLGLEEQAIDLAVFSLPVPVETLQLEILYEESLIPVAASVHPLAALSEVTWQDISRYPLILSRQKNGFGIRAVVEDLYHTYHSAIDSIVEVSGDQPLRQILLSGYGISFLPLSQFQKDLEEGLLVATQPPELSLTHQVAIATHPKHALSPAAERLIETMRKRCSSADYPIEYVTKSPAISPFLTS